jgi:biopolymer transport protein ExbB/TolQ
MRAIWISIAGVIVPPIIGLLGTVVGMMNTFGELSTEGQADPAALASNITLSMRTMGLDCWHHCYQ